MINKQVPFWKHLHNSSTFTPLVQPELDIVVYAVNAATAGAATVVCLRSVLMKPEHEEWLARITALLEASAQ